jgi:hypothetical protein
VKGEAKEKVSGVRDEARGNRKRNIMIVQTFFWLLTTVLLATVPTLHAQPAKKVFRIGYLSSVTAAAEGARAEVYSVGTAGGATGRG